MDIVTGHRGVNHVTSHQARMFNAGVFGDGRFILDGAAAAATDANVVHINAGEYLIDGAHMRTEGEDVVLGSSSGADYKRIDIICIHYRNEDGIESCDFEVVRGNQTTGTPAEPEISSNVSLLSKPSFSYIPVYRVTVEGLTISNVESLLTEYDERTDTAGFFSAVNSTGDVMLETIRTDTERSLGFGVEAGGTNAGIYDRNRKAWALLIPPTGDATFIGNAKGLTNTLPVGKGGTGATTVAGARNALGLGNTAGAVPIANGGTGSTTGDAALKALGAKVYPTAYINSGGWHGYQFSNNCVIIAKSFSVKGNAINQVQSNQALPFKMQNGGINISLSLFGDESWYSRQPPFVRVDTVDDSGNVSGVCTYFYGNDSTTHTWGGTLIVFGAKA